ncbi:MAG: beta-glucosidase [Alphaproteobacteria bacterium]|nr:beta-glucosidase [Alphaproteobacteria bacterium]
MSFPRGFIWGVSTSAYQIEGAAAVDGRAPSIWDVFCRQPGRIANGDTGDVACDHYHRYREDVALMNRLGVQAYRFSVSWSRVLPSGTEAPNEAGLAFYDRLVDAVLQAGIEPWLCLYHWDLPQALQERGGWTNRDVAGWFADYAQLIAARLGDRVKRFATFNEPCVFTLFGYAFGLHPPASHDPAALHAAIHHINLAHGAAVDALRARRPAAEIGGVHTIQPCRPSSPAPQDQAAAETIDLFWNHAFPDPQMLGVYPERLRTLVEPYFRDGDLERIRRKVDWLGVNHYSPIYAKGVWGAALGFGFGESPPEMPRTPIGWPIDPGAFRDTLLMANERYELPIYVTENGLGALEKPDDVGRIPDAVRIDYLGKYVEAMREAVDRGADVRGYFAWSLLDNFEWQAGYAQRFGLVYVDYATQRRIPKASADWYAALIRSERSKVP